MLVIYFQVTRTLMRQEKERDKSKKSQTEVTKMKSPGMLLTLLTEGHQL